MKSLSKVLVGSSLVLSATLFSIGCGGGGACCGGNDILAKVNVLSSNNLVNGNTLPLNDNTLNVNGFGSSSDATITKAVWTVYEDCNSRDTIVDGPKTVNTKDVELTLDLGTPGTRNVCVVVTDTNGNSDEDCTCITVQELNGPSASITGLARTLKVGCPLPAPTGENSTTNSGSDTLTYAWTLDGNAAGTAVTPTLPATLTATPTPHVVCLTVTDSNQISSEQCQDITIVPHSAPTAVIRVWNHLNEDQIDIPADSILSKSTQYDLSCSGSQDDCPQDEEDIECTWNASSYKSVNDSCYVEASTRDYYIQDCFDDAKHPGHGTQTTTPNTDSSLLSYITLCSSETEFDCIEVTMTATDKLHGDLNTTVSRIFKAQ